GMTTHVAAQSAADYPSKPIEFIVGFGAGGPSDVTARVLADELSKKAGQPVVVINKPGASAQIGLQEAANAAPDGYTITMGSLSTHVTAIELFKQLPYDPVKDFKIVS